MCLVCIVPLVLSVVNDKSEKGGNFPLPPVNTLKGEVTNAQVAGHPKCRGVDCPVAVAKKASQKNQGGA
jgi:hypothetical protein